jgi:3-vinyl bacteriochlorophyllide hydratase
MTASASLPPAGPSRDARRAGLETSATNDHETGVLAFLNRWFEMVAPCPWQAHIGIHTTPAPARSAQLYTPEQRARRDATRWTTVQAILAPLQFLTFAVSLGLVVDYLLTGRGYEVATASILVKTALLYAIMVTGSIWEKKVFDKWLFAHAFFWEDVFSFLVLGLQTAYLVALYMHWGSPRDQMLIAVAAYAAYVINATQFLLKLRAARLEAARSPEVSGRQISGRTPGAAA